MRVRLTGSPDPAAWKEVFDDFFKARIESRYFEPVRALAEMKKYAGEGFAIVTLHCSLIEFLASTVEGKTYRHRSSGDPPLRDSEYSNAREMFVRFLRKHPPFDRMFSGDEAATDFYASVRCGLFHEARTKGHWRIVVCPSASQAIDANAKIIHRNLMQSAFDQFIDWYGEQLPTDRSLQEAFIRKFDSLCEG